MKVKLEKPELFGLSTSEAMPQSYLFSREAWDGYMGQVWASFLAPMALSPQDAVIEVAAGGSTKIARALKEIEFKGTLYLVDPATQTLTNIIKMYRDLLPGVNIIGVPQTLLAASPKLPRDIAALVSNHPFDDMILAHASDVKDLDILFNWSSHDQDSFLPLLKKTWDMLLSDIVRLEEAKQKTVWDWAEALQTLRPRLCVLSQYPSSALAQSGMQTLNLHARDVFEKLDRLNVDQSASKPVLQEVLNRHKNYNNAHIGEHILNAKNWLMFENAPKNVN